MKPKKPKHQDQADLFRSRLDQILGRKHPLCILVNQIDWSMFDNQYDQAAEQLVGTHVDIQAAAAV